MALLPSAQAGIDINQTSDCVSDNPLPRVKPPLVLTLRVRTCSIIKSVESPGQNSLKCQPSPPPNPQGHLWVRGRRRLTFQTTAKSNPFSVRNEVHSESSCKCLGECFEAHSSFVGIDIGRFSIKSVTSSGKIRKHVINRLEV